MWAVAMQPRLCATTTTGWGAASTVRSSAPTQALRVGVIQSSCSTRMLCGRRCAHRLCQWPGPLPRQPGTMTMEMSVAVAATGSSSAGGGLVQRLHAALNAVAACARRSCAGCAGRGRPRCSRSVRPV